MKILTFLNAFRRPPLLLFTLAFSNLLSQPTHAEDVLLIGNSFTNSVVREVGLIAAARGKNLNVEKLTKSASAWKYHVGAPITSTTLASKKWNWVTIQDLSIEPTHIGNLEAFKADGDAFYLKIRELAPQAIIVLFETWPLASGSDIYGPQTTAKTFANPAEMAAELVKNYRELATKLEAKEPGPQVRLAPVGAAFARCMELYPELKLHGDDLKHAGDLGQYLAALVIYATLYQDSPVSMVPTPGIKIDAATAGKLQKVAEEVIAQKVAGKPIPSP